MMRRAQHLLVRIGTTLGVVLLLVSPAGSAPRRAHLSRDLADHAASGSNARVRVIVHGTSNQVQTLAVRHGLRISRLLDTAGVIEANAREIRALSEDVEVDHLSGDVLVRGGMSVTNTATGADQVWTKSKDLPGATGKGIVIAVIDSGIKTHKALNDKVIANVSFVTGGSTDEYGHGTHLAGIIAGNGDAAAKVTSLYNGGIAPGASLINVRVLGPDGSGLTSDVIAGIEWVVKNRAKYNIRVINLSLGHPVTEPTATDPICEAVARAVQAGIVVVASAGNMGKLSDGTPIVGAIESPGDSPYVITVGALNTHGTGERSDDTMATYSSRGPTRFEHLIKPDLVAPGNKIVSLLADSSYIQKNYPVGYVAGSGANAYYTMSGTSMATAVVSGGVALLLDANPNLNPIQVKLALQMSASFLPEAGLLDAGAGSINLLLARRIASQGLTDPLPGSSIAGSPMTPGGVTFWDAGISSNWLHPSAGMRVLWGERVRSVWTHPSRIIWGDLTLLGSGSVATSLSANRIIWSDRSRTASDPRIIWGDSDPRIIWGDSDPRIIWGDSDPRIIWGDSDPRIIWGDSDPRIIWGDSDPRIIWGDSILVLGDP